MCVLCPLYLGSFGRVCAWVGTVDDDGKRPFGASADGRGASGKVSFTGVPSSVVSADTLRSGSPVVATNAGSLSNDADRSVVAWINGRA